MGYIITGIIGIIGGLSGYLVLIGTNSSEALIIVSIGFVIFGIFKEINNYDNKIGNFKEINNYDDKKGKYASNIICQERDIIKKNQRNLKWKCPLCNEINEGYLLKCVCGYENRMKKS